MELKLCTKCAEVKPVCDYYERNDKPVAACKECTKSASRGYQLANHDVYKKRMREWYLANKDRALIESKNRIAKDREKHNSYVRKWADGNKDRIAQTQRERRAAAPGVSRAHCAKRRAAKLQSIPSWANMVEIEQYYTDAALFKSLGMDVQVDHIVPLQHPLVCGLHTHDNLQLLTAKSNLSKGNRFWPNMPNTTWN